MAQYGGWAAVECEGNPEESLYFLGRLMKVDSRYLTMKRVDALGNWLSDPLVLPLDDVTLVSFWRPVFGDLPEILQVRRRGENRMMARQTEARLLPGGDGLLPWEGNAASGDFRQAAVCCRKVGIIL